MNFYSNLMLLATVQLLCYVSVLEAYSNGSLLEACATMTPVHETFEPSTEPCLYETMPSQFTVIQGGSISVDLRNISSNSFRGYMTMAFDASKPDDAGPIGTFGMPTDGQLLSCPGGVNNTITHKDNNSIKRNVTAIWTAPADFVGSVIFKTTFVRGLSEYWVKVPSAGGNITVFSESTTSSPTTPPTTTTTSTPPTTTTTSTPPCGAAPSVSRSWIWGVILLIPLMFQQS
ncbi:putative Secreted protein [Daphnia magna]|uniref:Putative Secreted protein n=1 Tax=Daphnia magna TaxID=35525 RepID=A0A0P5YCZ9_9CRUS|nr:putative Secreted protein [Daphnia magna]